MENLVNIEKEKIAVFLKILANSKKNVVWQKFRRKGKKTNEKEREETNGLEEKRRWVG
ncbi:MAG: hypothetical protein IJY15_09335 [Thermoguttaceae bacterium]|nr:hypothetical protein [Thermoguttaceae bacterium]